MSSRSSDAVPARGSRLVHRAALGLTTLALAATSFAGIAPQSALADPPLTVAEAKSQVERLQTDAAALDQEYVAVQQKLGAGRKKLKTKQADVKAQTARVIRMRQQVGQVALAQFQNRSLDTAAQLFFTEDTDGFLSQISTVEKVSENQNATLQDYQAEQGKLTELERSSASDVALLKQQDAELKRLRKASDDKVAEAKTVLAKLTVEERARIAAEEKKAAEEARQQAENSTAAAATTGSAAGATNSTNTTDTPTDTGGSSKGAQVLSFAKAQIGKPYVFAAEGPGSYDCSGLTLAAWRTVGVSLPRISWDQIRVGRSVSRSQLQAGDLVFFYSNRSHVGIYAGNGMIIHAPRPGKSVEYTKMSYMPFNGASRPG